MHVGPNPMIEMQSFAAAIIRRGVITPASKVNL